MRRIDRRRNASVARHRCHCSFKRLHSSHFLAPCRCCSAVTVRSAVRFSSLERPCHTFITHNQALSPACFSGAETTKQCAIMLTLHLLHAGVRAQCVYDSEPAFDVSLALEREKHRLKCLVNSSVQFLCILFLIPYLHSCLMHAAHREVHRASGRVSVLVCVR